MRLFAQAAPVLACTAIGLTSLGCQPLSTKDLGQQENAIQAEGQLAMQEQSGSVGNPAYAEAEPNVNLVKDPFDPDPFVANRTQELTSREVESDEVPGEVGEGIGTDPVEVDPSGNIGQP
ncbi:MAG: hypothetical protein VX527_02815 [Planctomycetota bacterium]|nr:hypothetical protein [Planctomycetota bacterium]